MFENFKKVKAIKKAINHTKLSIVERSSLLNEVLTRCFINDEYHPEYLKPVFTLAVLRSFTTISPTMLKNEDDTVSEYVDVEATYKYCRDNHIMDYIIGKVDYMYIDSIFEECVEAIEFKKAQIIAEISNKSSVSDSIILSVTNVIDSVRKMVENFDPSQYKDVIELVNNANKFNVTKNDFINGIVKNLPKKEGDKVEVKSDKVDDITFVPSPTEDK